jgi:hypothetical protein
MIDDLAYLIKVILFLVGAYQLSKLSTFGVPFGIGCLIIVFFMTGVELFTPGETPWTYLFSDVSTMSDVEKSFIGGSLFLVWAATLFIVISKNWNNLNEKGRGF